MIRYKNIRGNSNVVAYSYGSDYIDVMFGDHSIYRYTERSAGHLCINAMKHHADEGCGLNGYINKYAKYSYAEKWRA